MAKAMQPQKMRFSQAIQTPMYKNLNHLDLICEALDCSPTEILVREPNPEPRVRNRTGFEKPVTGQRKDGE